MLPVEKLRYSSVAQWQSIRLLTEGLQVRVPPGEFLKKDIARCLFLLGFNGTFEKIFFCRLSALRLNYVPFRVLD